MKKFWTNKRVLVTGGTGFIGSFLTEQLVKKGANVLVTTKSGKLTNVEHLKKNIRIMKANLVSFEDALRVSKGQDIILNLASRVAGIQFNINHPATMFADNIIINKNMLDAAIKNNVERFLIASSVCVYPRNSKIPIKESDGFLGEPEPTNLGYGWSKRTAELLGKFYNSEYGLKISIVRPSNTYGPRDNFDLEKSHVIPGIIKRIYDGENPLKVWGSGKQTRSFLYVEDLARGLIEAVEKYPVPDPVNIGSEEEISIGNLARLLIKLTNKKIQIQFDLTKPDGQPRRKSDIRTAKEKFGYEARIPLTEGLRRTIVWYKQHL